MVFFKRLSSHHVYKEIKLQEIMDGIDYILCKTDINLNRRLAYKCNTIKDEHFETRFKSAACTFELTPVWIQHIT